MLIREQVNRLWYTTGFFSEEVRRAAYPIDVDPATVDLTGPWSDVMLSVDLMPVVFKVLQHDRVWFANARHGHVLLGVEAQTWPQRDTALVTVTDLGPYAAGTRELRSP